MACIKELAKMLLNFHVVIMMLDKVNGVTPIINYISTMTIFLVLQQHLNPLELTL